MLVSSLSQTEKAFRDTIITKSVGDWLKRLSRIMNIPHNGETDAIWREILKTCAFAPRGNFGVFFRTMREMTRSLEEAVTCSVGPANVRRLTKLAGVFGEEYIGRLVEVPWTSAAGEDIVAIYLVTGPSPAGVGYLELCPYKTPYWAGARFDNTNASCICRFLPFRMYETGGLHYYVWNGDEGSRPCRVVIDMMTGMLSDDPMFPPTYLQPNAVDPRPTAPPGVDQPIGGYLMQDAEHAYTIDPATPIYLGGTGSDGTSYYEQYKSVLDNLLVAGVDLLFRDVND